MSNFGFRDLRLVNAYQVAFQEARSATHAASVLREARTFGSLSEAVADCSRVVGATGTDARDLRLPLQRLEDAARDLKSSAGDGQSALVFGSEKHGLSREDISHCHSLLHIPTQQGHDSMNLGQAVAVCLYELIRETPQDAAGDHPRREAPVAMLDLLQEQWFTLLVRTGYVKRRVSRSASLKLRQLLRRLRLSEEDATLLVGMVRQVHLAIDDPAIGEKSRRDWSVPPCD